MANIIKPKRSTVAGKVPTTSDLTNGEIAINSTDKKIYTNAGGTITQVGAGALTALSDTNITSPSNGEALKYDSASGKWINSAGGAGDVTGAASSTDNAVVRFDGTTGKVIQNSTVTLDDNGNFANANSVGFDVTPAGTLPTAPGSLYWDSSDGIQTLNLVMANGDATQQIGQEQYYRVKASSAITNGQVVMFTGTVGASGGLTAAPATGLTASTASYVMGIATQDIALNSWGYITSFGLVRQIDTSAFTDGAILYLNPSVAGGLTTTIPSAPNPKVQVCAVVYAAANGSLFVRPSFGGILGQYEGDVEITTPANGNLLIRNQTSGKWVNANLTAGTGITITNAAGSVTAAIDSTVATLSGTQTLTNKTISGASNTLSNIGNASLTNSSITINGSAISLGGTVSVGTVTSVGMTVPTGLTITGSPITTSGTLAITFTAGYSIPTTASQTNWDTAYSDRLKWDGGSTGLVAATGRTSLGATTLGSNIFTITNPSAITFPRFNADNTVSALTAADFRTAIGAGTGSGTVTSVGGTGTVAGITLSGTVTSSGNLTLGGTFALPSGQVPGKMIYDSFTATASQTTFTPSNSYTSGKIEVYANGVKMVNGSDVTVTSGTSVVFASGLASGTLVDLVYPI